MSSVRIPKKLCEDQFRLVEPQINAEGIHTWPFDAAFPIDVRFMTSGPGHNVRKNRHEYFELAYLCAGAASLEIQDRSLPLQEGDLAVVGSTLYHRFECRSELMTLAEHVEMARSSRGNRRALELLLNVIGTTPNPNRDEDYFGEALDYHLGHLYAHLYEFDKAATHLNRSNTHPHSGGDLLFSEQSAEALALHAKQLEAIGVDAIPARGEAAGVIHERAAE